MYITIAKGIIDTLKSQYGIYVDDSVVTTKHFLNSVTQTSLQPQAFPVVSVDSIVYDGTTLDPTAYSFYGEDILLVSPITDIRKPLEVTMTVGFNGNVPDDLILAIYRHILATFYAIDKHTDNVSKTTNSSGSTTHFVRDALPLASLNTYRYYAGNTYVTT